MCKFIDGESVVTQANVANQAAELGKIGKKVQFGKPHQWELFSIGSQQY